MAEKQKGRPSEVKGQKELLIQKLREKGFRITKQRRILLDIILKQHCASCKEIYYQANKIDSAIGVATVYRMLHALEELGAIDRRNLYKIEYTEEKKEGTFFLVTLEDGSSFDLSVEQWAQVIWTGLHGCGYIQKEKIVSIRKSTKADIY